jgi:hypothetical protein
MIVVRKESLLKRTRRLSLGSARLGGPPFLAQELYERRAAERRERRKVRAWFAVQDLLPEPWEREAIQIR